MHIYNVDQMSDYIYYILINHNTLYIIYTPKYIYTVAATFASSPENNSDDISTDDTIEETTVKPLRISVKMADVKPQLIFIHIYIYITFIYFDLSLID